MAPVTLRRYLHYGFPHLDWEIAMNLPRLLGVTEDLQHGFLFWLFGGDEPHHPLEPHQVAMRCAVIYLAGVVIVRIGKSRLVSRVTTLDIIVGFMLGSILARGITGTSSITETIVAAAALVAVHYLLTLATFHSHALGKLIKGNSHAVIEDGRPLEGALYRAHISESDLLEQLHLKGVDKIEDVQVAYKERNGEVSVIPRKQLRLVELPAHDGVQTIRIELVG